MLAILSLLHCLISAVLASLPFAASRLDASPQAAQNAAQNAAGAAAAVAVTSQCQVAPSGQRSTCIYGLIHGKFASGIKNINF